MQISTQSAFFRSAKFWNELFSEYSFYAPRDLCTFLRRYLLKVFFKSIFLFILGFAILGAISDAVIFFFGGHWSLLLPKQAYWSDALFYAGMMAWGLIGCATLVCVLLGLGWCVKWAYERTIAGTGQALAETVVGQYVNGKLHQFCPNLDFVDPNSPPAPTVADFYDDEPADSDEALMAHEESSNG